MKFNQQQHPLITEEYNYETNIWTINIQNTEAGLNKAIEKIKKAKELIKLGEKEDESFAKEQEYLQEVLNFLSYNYVASDKDYITATDLRQYFLQFNHLSNSPITASKFGMLMTSILNNPEINIFNIKRIKIKSGNAYFGIKQIL